eukprot:jgi/Mesvir1/23562/Mv18258-RA.1
MALLQRYLSPAGTHPHFAAVSTPWLTSLSSWTDGIRLKSSGPELPACLPGRAKKCGSLTVVAAAKGKGGKGKSKPKASKRDQRRRGFQSLMMRWEDAMDSTCQDPDRVAKIVGTASEGLSREGRGFVFMKETLETTTIGKGFGGLTEDTSNMAANTECLSWSIFYIPAWAIQRKEIPEGTIVQGQSQGEYLTIEELQDILNGSRVDLPRLLGLLKPLPSAGGDGQAPVPAREPAAPGASKLGATEPVDGMVEPDDVADARGGLGDDGLVDMVGVEAPYNPDKGELVLMSCVVIDGQLVSGADVYDVKRQVGKDGKEATWLELRGLDELLGNN